MNSRWCFVASLLLAATAWCSCGKKPSIQPLAPDAVIVAFGDSLTSGHGAAAEAAYPVVLGQRLQRRVINAGMAGEISAQGLARLPLVVEQWQPALVILCHGGNDLLQRLDLQKTRGNLSAMIQYLRQRGIDVILVGVPQPKLGLVTGLSTAPLYEELAAEFQLPFEGRIVAQVLSRTATRQADRIHPNEKGCRQMAEALADLVEESQAR